MVAPQSQQITIACPGCGARFMVRQELAGRRGRCPKCQQVIAITPAAPAEKPARKRPKPSPRKPPEPQYIGFECRVCETPLYGTPAQVGKAMKCPDCGAKTVVPPPKKVVPKRQPAALEGEQYELWEDDSAGTAWQAAQPQLVPVECRLCQTLVYASPEQIGQTLTCPDCHTKNVVQPPVPKPARKSVLETSGDDIVLAPVAASVTQNSFYSELYESAAEEERQRVAALNTPEARRTQHAKNVDADGRPIMPRYPLVTGVVEFIHSPGVAVRAVVLSLTLILVGVLLVSAVEHMRMSLGLTSIFGVMYLGLTFALGWLWSTAAAAISMTIVAESADGNDVMQSWPKFNPVDWFGDWFYFLVAVAASAGPGWLLAANWIQTTEYKVLAISLSIWALFPVVLLSELEYASPWGILSLRLLQGFVARPFSTIYFYFSTALLCGGFIAALMVFKPSLYAGLALVPVGMIVGIEYLRLIGRFAWKLSEVTADELDDDDD